MRIAIVPTTGLVGSRLRALREEHKLTQEELAREMGVAYQQVWRWETGKNDPSGDALARMARRLDVTVDYLLGLVDDRTASITGDSLSELERQLIAALRSGQLAEALQTLAALSQTTDAGEVSGR